MGSHDFSIGGGHGSQGARAQLLMRHRQGVSQVTLANDDCMYTTWFSLVQSGWAASTLYLQARIYVP